MMSFLDFFALYATEIRDDVKKKGKNRRKKKELEDDDWRQTLIARAE